MICGAQAAPHPCNCVQMLFSHAWFGKQREQAYRISLLSWSVWRCNARKTCGGGSVWRNGREADPGESGLLVSGRSSLMSSRPQRLSPIRGLSASDNLGV